VQELSQRDDLPRDADVSEPMADEADDEYDGLSPTFAAACRAADEKQFRNPRDPRIERLRRLMANDVSLDRAWHELSDRPPGDVPIATLRAAEYLLPLGDLERWKKWFDAHSAPERAAILQHLEQRKRRQGE